MKIKLDFVSNSSSTSFIYIGDGKLTKAHFFSAIGIDEKSPVIEIFEGMYETLNSAIREGEIVLSEHDLTQPSEYPDFPNVVVEKAKTALQEGKKVVIGRLSSDGDISESFLCMEAFEIESADFYINAFDNYW